MNLAAAFLLGLLGSLHCAAMCGPLLLAVNAALGRKSANPGTHPGAATSGLVNSLAPRSGERVRGRGLSHASAALFYNLAYHAGRIFTYSILGAISGLIGAAIIFAGLQRWLSIAAGSLILLGALGSLRTRWAGIPGKVVSSVKAKFGRSLGNRTLGGAAVLGGLNGLLPCGLVYMACAVAAAAGGLGAGIATMLAFGLGTAPMLLSIGLAGKAIRWGNPLHLRRVVLAGVTLAGVLLIVRGLSLGIPYLSPHFSDGQGPTCNCHHAM